LKTEVSCGFITFTIKNGQPFYLILKHPTHWSFPKGHVEEGENLLQAATRELREETGIEKFRLIDGFEEKISYYFTRFGETVCKEVTYFLAEVPPDTCIKLSGEHKAYKWSSYRETLKALYFDNIKEVLRKAHRVITRIYGL